MSWPTIPTDELYEMTRTAHSIGCVYIAAEAFHQRRTVVSLLRLLRTKHAAVKQGVDPVLVNETSRIAGQVARK